MQVSTCCEPDLAAQGVVPARCIDPDQVLALSGQPLLQLKPAPTRKGCGCVQARDIGAYHCCAHGCVYCYANESPSQGAANAHALDPGANHLGVGDLEPSDPARWGTSARQLSLPGAQPPTARAKPERPNRSSC